MARGAVHIGTSGWHYAHWVGPFYPEGTRPAAFLDWYARHFRSVELNNTFYRLPSRETLAAWRDGSPTDFLFACKASRFITHAKKLKDPEQGERFFDTIAVLGGKLGPILFQLPPRWRVNAARLAAYLETLPAGHRYAFEFRDPSWFADDIYRLLERHGAGFCIYDLDRRRSPVLVTAAFAYVRLHGPGGPYRGRYGEPALREWAGLIRGWRDSGLDAYCYFDNDEAGYAAQDAACLAAMLADGAGRDG